MCTRGETGGDDDDDDDDASFAFSLLFSKRRGDRPFAHTLFM
jgi:hypothetical protein